MLLGLTLRLFQYRNSLPPLNTRVILILTLNTLSSLLTHQHSSLELFTKFLRWSKTIKSLSHWLTCEERLSRRPNSPTLLDTTQNFLLAWHQEIILRKLRASGGRQTFCESYIATRSLIWPVHQEISSNGKRGSTPMLPDVGGEAEVILVKELWLWKDRFPRS